MEDFSFTVPQDIVFGTGRLQELPMLVSRCNASRAMIVSDRGLEGLGVIDKVVRILEDAGIATSSFLDVLPNPTVEMVDAAAEAYRSSGATCIVALGGGSPMDTAKAVGVLVRHGGSIIDYEGARNVPGAIEPIIAIPTTAGTGSEVTPFSVITDEARNHKLTVFSYEILPAQVLLDPQLIMTAPASVAAACGVDAMIHAWEAYTNLAANPFTDAMADDAMTSGNIAVNPRSTTKRDVIALYHRTL